MDRALLSLAALLAVFPLVASSAEPAKFDEATRAPYSSVPSKSRNGKTIAEMKQKVQESWDKIVFKKVQALLGGKLKFAGTGSAPLAPKAQMFVQTAFNCPVRQGYGLTEAGPVVSVNRLHDNAIDSVGIVLEGVETKVGPDNELLVRGAGVMRGYWQDEAATARTISAGHGVNGAPTWSPSGARSSSGTASSSAPPAAVSSCRGIGR